MSVVAQGAKAQNVRRFDAFRTALFFGVFEALFPILGWALGLMLGSVMAQIDHWIAFFLLLAIGLKMIRDGFAQSSVATGHPNTPSAARMAAMALATSIDAAAVGVTLVVLDIPILQAAAIIGAVTFAFTYTGYTLGGLINSRLPRYAETVGGFLLIGIGCKILIEHTLLN